MPMAERPITCIDRSEVGHNHPDKCHITETCATAIQKLPHPEADQQRQPRRPPVTRLCPGNGTKSGARDQPKIDRPQAEKA